MLGKAMSQPQLQNKLNKPCSMHPVHLHMNKRNFLDLRNYFLQMSQMMLMVSVMVLLVKQVVIVNFIPGH